MNRLEKLEISNVIGDFRAALETLDRYDHQQLDQEFPRTNLPDLRRQGTLSDRADEGGNTPVSACQEPLLCRWQQTHCCVHFLVVYVAQRYPLSSGRFQNRKRWRSSRAHAAHRRKQTRRT